MWSTASPRKASLLRAQGWDPTIQVIVKAVEADSLRAPVAVHSSVHNADRLNCTSHSAKFLDRLPTHVSEGRVVPIGLSEDLLIRLGSLYVVRWNVQSLRQGTLLHRVNVAANVGWERRTGQAWPSRWGRRMGRASWRPRSRHRRRWTRCSSTGRSPPRIPPQAGCPGRSCSCRRHGRFHLKAMPCPQPYFTTPPPRSHGPKSYKKITN